MSEASSAIGHDGQNGGLRCACPPYNRPKRNRLPLDMHSRTLLTHTDPPPFRVLRPNGGSDFFLTADHAGRAVPRRLGDLGVPPGEWQRHIAWDIGIAAITERLSASLDA